MINRKSSVKKTIKKKTEADVYLDYIKNGNFLKDFNNNLYVKDNINNFSVFSMTSSREYKITINSVDRKPQIYCNCVSHFNPNASRISNCKHIKLFLCNLIDSTSNNLIKDDENESTISSLFSKLF